MSQDQWTAVDDYFVNLLLPPDAALDAALEASTAAGLPTINVTANQGQLLYLWARMIRARAILEIGTLGGYSTIWLARALPQDGHLITLELDPHHAEVARQNIERAGLSEKVEIRVGPAIDTLPHLTGDAPFDLIFIDADKVSTPAYLEWSMKLAKVGSLIIVDNVVRNGGVIDPNHEDPNVQGVRRALADMAADQRLQPTAIQTVGSKGYDGFAMALVVG